MRSIFINSKKAQEAGTLSWIFGTIIILIIMIIYVVLTSALFAKRGGTNMGQFDNPSKSAITESLIGFLDSEAGEYGTVYDLLYRAEEKGDDSEIRRELFKQKAEAYFSTHLSRSSYDYSLDLISLGAVSSISGYSVSYFDMSAASETAALAQQYEYSFDITLPIIPDKKLKLFIAKRTW